MSKLLIALFLIFTFGCEDRKYTYIDSSIGVLTYSYYNCINELAVTNEGVNLLDKDSSVVTCKGYLRLTDKELKDRLSGAEIKQ